MFVKRLPIAADSVFFARHFFVAGACAIWRLPSGKMPWTRSQYKDKTE
jgi:hypothetical protein